ncbi:hypothetical protein OEZ86_012236 [Tetradesmus obliquus]|nr:hypothetical protein OEZ86_012236 [Tetradesmus obliquus]
MDSLLWAEAIPEDAKEAPQGLKPEEEIARFTVDEHLNEVERCNLFLTGGHAVQKRRAIESLPQLLKAKGRAAWEAVQANLLLSLQKLDLDAQESEAWLLLLLDMLPVLPHAHLLDAVLPLALGQGQVNEPVASRVSCCRLLGAMAPHLAPADVSAKFAPQLLAACQDTDYQVRIAAAQQLPALARVLGAAAAVSQVLPELKELLEDDEVQVRVAGLSGLVALCQLLPGDAQVAHMLPLVRRHMQPLELALPLQRALAAAFPDLLAAVRNDLEPSDAGLLYGCFRHLAARADVELRRLCASRLPALMASPLPGSSASYLHDTWTDLALDHDMQVRVAIASQLHLVAATVAPAEASRLLLRPLVALLRDGCPAVRQALLPGLGQTLQVLSGADVMHKDAVASDVHQALVALAGSIASNWRCQQHLAAAIPALPGLLGQDVLCEHWAPYSFDLLLTGAACVKPAAASSVAHLLHSCRRERPRTELYSRIIRELAWGRSCWARLAYTQLVVAALPLFSCRWVKEHLLEGVLGLLGDGVPNVRLAALGLLPALKQTIRLPEDVERLEHLNSAMSNLMTDNDRDVSHAARTVHDTFKRTALRVTGGAGLLEMNGSSSGAADFEAADHAKEEAEVDLTLSQEEMEK